ncbi:hypothetical protein HDF26_002284 [Pedobacter cryoconitis]|uniref:hypothetical protein n=1 Tax=Pedobacter cryoconitis TaxID=188932 RepID=UPI00161F5B4E|nr:hypothetical protein [Pedobacter cryoconitis]MBB6271827.1 hypothetical protein [Pedobacter cryoconitis]
MSTKSSSKYLKQLNRESVFVTFENAWWFWDFTDSVEADYFGMSIKVWFPNCIKSDPDDLEQVDTFSVEVFDPEKEKTDMCFVKNQAGEQEFGSITKAIEVVNAYIQSRPFTIKLDQDQQYKLYDPNGQVFGEGGLLSLEQAMHLCDYNFNLEE